MVSQVIDVRILNVISLGIPWNDFQLWPNGQRQNVHNGRNREKPRYHSARNWGSVSATRSEQGTNKANDRLCLFSSNLQRESVRSTQPEPYLELEEIREQRESTRLTARFKNSMDEKRPICRRESLHLRGKFCEGSARSLQVRRRIPGPCLAQPERGIIPLAHHFQHHFRNTRFEGPEQPDREQVAVSRSSWLRKTVVNRYNWSTS